ncbi:MAG: serine/threonine protein kinase, partial [Myxococcaceae bacterium]|nr:serine/threonine protein kinase [Myxococcaceae bacterium]
MAQLLLARKEGPAGFSKLVAIKQVLPHIAGNAEFVKMFLDEARIAARLDHPNIVHVQDFGEAGGTYYLAMEYLQGRDLTALLASGPVPPVIAALIGSAVCSGLHYAHTLARDDGTPLKVVHRDISPSNIFLTMQGAVKVLDFGIAKAEGKLSETKAGWLKGKPLYMSPEQIWSKPLDARSDVWAVGVVLYELVTGKKPFDRAAERAIIEAIEKEQPRPLGEVRLDVPPAFAALVHRCLEKAPEQRFQSALELRRALDGFVAEHSSAPSQGQLQEFIEALVPPVERAPSPSADVQVAIPTLLQPDTGVSTQGLPAAPAPP